MQHESDEQVYKRIQAEHGSKGGAKTKERHGRAFFSKIGKKGSKTKKTKGR